SDGNGSLEECFAIARSHLDFWALTDHAYGEHVFSHDYRHDRADHLILHEVWPQVQDLCRAYEALGAFIPFLAYEWTNFGFGHHNVYYLDYDQPIRMPATLPELYDLGLVAAYADELTRRSLWDAFKAKRVYGVTGDRISLALSVDGHRMGNVVPA